jgi:hypothetical protein
MSVNKNFSFSSKVWLYPGKAAWHFLTLPKNLADEISENFGYFKQGWGSIKVVVKIQETVWETSIFQDKKSQSYLLPIKSAIRKKLDIKENDEITINLEIKYAL